MRSRNLWLLAISQALGNSGSSLMVFVGGLVGADIAPSETLATLPISLMVVGAALFTIPVALLMGRVGRRKGYLLGAAIGILAAGVGMAGVLLRSFPLFCAAAVLIGANSTFIAQYRFGAAESVPPKAAGQAVSFVLVGGMVSGVLGPEIARRSENWLPAAFSASFLILAGLYGLSLLLLIFLKDIAPVQLAQSEPDRPLRRLITQPLFITAVLAGAVANGVMSLIMTATPVEMHIMHGFTQADTALVIESHIIAMYLPSLFSPILFARLKMQWLMLTGVFCLMGCVGLGLYSTALLDYWGALVLLGLGWNFLFVGATALLTLSYRPSEKFRAQAVNDFTIYGIQALASLSAGTLIFRSTWSILLWTTVPALLLMLGALLLTARHLAGVAKPAVVET